MYTVCGDEQILYIKSTPEGVILEMILIQSPTTSPY